MADEPESKDLYNPMQSPAQQCLLRSPAVVGVLRLLATLVAQDDTSNHLRARIDNPPMFYPFRTKCPSALPLIVEPELDGHIPPGVLRRQRTKRIDALQRPRG